MEELAGNIIQLLAGKASSGLLMVSGQYEGMNAVPSSTFGSQAYQTMLNSALSIGQWIADTILPYLVVVIAFRFAFSIISGFLTGNSPDLGVGKTLQYLALILIAMFYIEIFTLADNVVSGLVKKLDISNAMTSPEYRSSALSSLEFRDRDKLSNQASNALSGYEGRVKRAMADIATNGKARDVVDNEQRKTEEGINQPKSLSAFQKFQIGLASAGGIDAGAAISSAAMDFVAAPSIASFGLAGMLEYVAGEVLTLVRMVVEWISIVLSMVLLPFGAIACLTTAIPGIADNSLKDWFTTWIGIKFWIVTVAVIDFMMVVFNDNFKGNAEMGFGDGLTLVGLNIIFIAMYIIVPLITSYYIKYKGGAMLSAVVGATTMAIKSTMSAATNVATGGKSLAAKYAGGGGGGGGAAKLPNNAN